MTPRFAEYFATVLENGEIAQLCEAYPPHELLPNQVMLTEREHKLLRVVKSIQEAEALLNSVKYKIGELSNDSSKQSK